MKGLAIAPNGAAHAVPSSSQTPGDRIEDLVSECATRIDNGLSPLVAAGAVDTGLASIIAASLQFALGDCCGETLKNVVFLPRTLTAVQTVGKCTAEASGGAR